MPTKKATKKAATKKKKPTATVTLDARTADKLAAALRRNLAASNAYMVYQYEANKSQVKAADPVHLDPDETAEFINYLHNGLHDAGAISDEIWKKSKPKKK